MLSCQVVFPLCLCISLLDICIPSLTPSIDLHLFQKSLFPVLNSTLNKYLKKINRVLKEEYQGKGWW